MNGSQTNPDLPLEATSLALNLLLKQDILIIIYPVHRPSSSSLEKEKRKIKQRLCNNILTENSCAHTLLRIKGELCFIVLFPF